tara:strand:- start:46 stop:342 length:297 start_codon:yes stop_codon:yes gene_type:complete
MAKRKPKGRRLNTKAHKYGKGYKLYHGTKEFGTLTVRGSEWTFHTNYNAEGLSIAQLEEIIKEMKRINEEDPIEKTLKFGEGKASKADGWMVEEVHPS